MTLDGGKEKGPNSKLTKARQSKGSNHPPQGVPQRRYMVVDGLGVARAQFWRRGGLSKDPHRPLHRLGVWLFVSQQGWYVYVYCICICMYVCVVFNCICFVIVI